MFKDSQNLHLTQFSREKVPTTITLADYREPLLQSKFVTLMKRGPDFLIFELSRTVQIWSILETTVIDKQEYEIVKKQRSNR